MEMKVQIYPKFAFKDSKIVKSNYLWKKIRHKNLVRADFRCELCKRKFGNRGKKLFCEEIWDFDFDNRKRNLCGFVVICDKCSFIRNHKFMYEGYSDKKFYMHFNRYFNPEHKDTSIMIRNGCSDAYQIYNKISKSGVKWKTNLGNFFDKKNFIESGCFACKKCGKFSDTNLPCKKCGMTSFWKMRVPVI